MTKVSWLNSIMGLIKPEQLQLPARELEKFVTSTIVDGFQNNLTQLFSITCRCAILNVCSCRLKVKVTLKGQNFFRT